MAGVLADKPGRSLGLPPHRIPLTWLEKPNQQPAGDYARWIKHGGLKRYYELHIPPNYRPGEAIPLVLVLHGGGGNPSQVRWQANMEKEADKRGYALLYPAGTHPIFKDKALFWNVGPKRKNKRLRRVDDVAFLSKVLDDASQFFNIDPRRIYATGISNGAHMTYRMGAESGRLAAIAPIAGQEKLGAYFQAPEQGLPILHFHGVQDKWNPVAGGRTTKASGFESRYLPPLDEHIESWAQANGCQLNPARGEETPLWTKLVYDEGKDGSEVVLLLLKNAGHTWPSGRVSEIERTGKIVGKKIGPGGVGPVSSAKAAQLSLDFFDRHRLTSD